jgi:hypothetical protein
MQPLEQWWPKNLGQPNSAGSQNDLHYAYFADSHRLAVRQNDKTTLYDTGSHRIGGVSQQQQNNAQNATFTSQNGDVRLADLHLVE